MNCACAHELQLVVAFWNYSIMRTKSAIHENASFQFIEPLGENSRNAVATHFPIVIPSVGLARSRAYLVSHCVTLDFTRYTPLIRFTHSVGMTKYGIVPQCGQSPQFMKTQVFNSLSHRRKFMPARAIHHPLVIPSAGACPVVERIWFFIP